MWEKKKCKNIARNQKEHMFQEKHVVGIKTSLKEENFQSVLTSFLRAEEAEPR